MLFNFLDKLSFGTISLIMDEAAQSDEVSDFLPTIYFMHACVGLTFELKIILIITFFYGKFSLEKKMCFKYFFCF